MVTSVARRSLAAGSSRTCAVVGARQVSSEVHHDEHHSDSDHPTGPETLFTPFWRNAIIGGVLAYGLLSTVPAPSESNKDGGAISKFITKHIADPQEWMTKNEIHTIAAERTAHGRLISQTAQRPSIYRYKFPSIMESHSPHLVPVGTNVDVSRVTVRREGS